MLFIKRAAAGDHSLIVCLMKGIIVSRFPLIADVLADLPIMLPSL